MLFGGTAFFVRDWRHLSYAISVASAISFLLLPFLLESPKWLLERKNFAKAKKNFLKIAAWNKVRDFENQAFRDLMDFEFQTGRSPAVKSYSFKNLFYSRQATAQTLTLCFCFFTGSLITYGTIL